MINQESSGTGSNFAANRDVNINIGPKHFSILSEIINSLGGDFDSELSDDKTEKPFNIQEKLDYNNINRFKVFIDEYHIYVGKLTSVYREYEKQGSNKVHNLLTNIRRHYLVIKNNFTSDIETEDEMSVIRSHADDIIEEIEKSLMNEVQHSSNIKEPVETIRVSLLIVIIDALIKCKILEEPK